MTDLIFGSRMHVAMRVIMRASSHASVREVTVLVNMEAVELAGAQARESSTDKSTSEDTLLFEVHYAFAGLVWLGVHDTDCSTRFYWQLCHLRIADKLLFAALL